MKSLFQCERLRSLPRIQGSWGDAVFPGPPRVLFPRRRYVRGLVVSAGVSGLPNDGSFCVRESGRAGRGGQTRAEQAPRRPDSRVRPPLSRCDWCLHPCTCDCWATCDRALRVLVSRDAVPGGKVSVCVHICACACLCVCMCACARARMDTEAEPTFQGRQATPLKMFCEVKHRESRR